MHEVQVLLYDQGEKVAAFTFDKPVELGRQIKSTEVLYATQPTTEGTDRLVIARLNEDSISKRHARLEPLADGRVRVTNLSAVQPIRFEVPAGLQLLPQERRDIDLPQLLRLGISRVVRVQSPVAEEEQSVSSLGVATLPPGSMRSSRFPAMGLPSLPAKEMVDWFNQVMELFQSSATPKEFFDRATRAVVDLLGLDTGRVLMLYEGEWSQQASYSSSNVPPRAMRPSWTLLGKLVQRKAPCFESPGALTVVPASMTGLEGLVAAPILDRGGKVIGALYGERQLRPTGKGFLSAQATVGELEARLMELLARALAAGLDRIRPEAEARANLALFEQFFTHEVARFLVGNRDWEKWSRRPITLLFCDVQGYSRIIGKLSALGAQEVMAKWCRAVLDKMSASVLDRQGVLIDYIGDGLLAMWGAPGDQPDHAARACEAALIMLEGLDELNREWAESMGKIGEKIDVTIGVNSGDAHVGNIGSKYKFKYGAQGDPVNIASRVQTANRYFKSRVLVTGSTRNDPAVRDRFLMRRLGTALLKNISEPVDLYELAAEGRVDMPAWKEEYERALELFDQKSFRPAARILAQRRDLHEEDGPALVLLSRAVNAGVDGPAAHHPVWRLADK
jgi:adenylate cyclase